MHRRAPKRAAALIAAIALALAAAVPAQALPNLFKNLVQNLRTGFVWVDPGAKVKVDSAAFQAAATRHRGYRLAIIGRLPTKYHSAAQTADAALRGLPRTIAFVGIAYKRTLGGASRTMTPENVALAAKQAQARNLPSTVDTLAAFADIVASGKVEQPKAAGGGGRSIWSWLLIVLAIVVVALAAAFTFLRYRAREARRRRRGGSILTAREFHSQRIDGLAHRHSELVRATTERGEDSPLAGHHQTAGAKLVALRRQLPQLYAPRELRTCALELDEIEWHIECCEAIVANTGLPPKPGPERNGLCFFTHEHGLATVDVDLTKPDGTIATVRVCPVNAVALERGEPPHVSMVHVGNRMVPWPASPTWYGGAGWSPDDLPGLEYGHHEIWGRDMPMRDASLVLPDDADLPGREAPAAAGGLDLPPGVSAPDLFDLDGREDNPLPPGISLPDDDDTHEASGAHGPATYEELDRPDIPGLIHDPDAPPAPTPPRGRRRAAAGDDETVAYDPFADSDDEPPAGAAPP